MPSTHFSLHYHFVFSTKDRRAIIDPLWHSRLFAYLGGTIRAVGGTALSVGGVADHVHLLAGLRTTHKISDVLNQIKHSSSQWIHENIGEKDFSWQQGYGAFTVSRSQIDIVKKYIERQEEHHRRKAFESEYVEMLEKNGVEYDEKYLW